MWTYEDIKEYVVTNDEEADLMCLVEAIDELTTDPKTHELIGFWFSTVDAASENE